jgi:hypothetical protein
MDGQRLEVVLRTQANHFFGVFAANFVRLPLAWARRENLQRVATKAIRAFGSGGNASGGRGVNADASGGQLWRLGRRRDELEDVSFLGLGSFRHQS